MKGSVRFSKIKFLKNRHGRFAYIFGRIYLILYEFCIEKRSELSFSYFKNLGLRKIRIKKVAAIFFPKNSTS